ncbi:MAG TPA: lysophospholipid acyltransferase family protein [Gemmataceae bacterium]|nr:lysophospholipid acyltransferase family protein [Gemmataceae bacterium]
MPPWLADRWWDVGKVACFYTMTGLFSLRTTGGQNVPRTGPVLILSNHQTFFDPVFIGLAVPRYVSWVARQTLRKNRWLARLIDSLRAIPIDHRGFSREGLQATLDALDRGACVGMFPEGERTHDGSLEPFKPGISLLIKRTRAPIVPAGIAGGYAAWSRHRKLPRFAPLFRLPTDATIAVSVGKPIDPIKYEKNSREEMLEDLRGLVRVEVEKAEKLRRKRRK